MTLMGDSWVIPVIVGILILGTLGFSQEADADHESLKVGTYWGDKYDWPGIGKILVCSSGGQQASILSGWTVIIPDYDWSLPEHPPCVSTFKDSFLNEGVVYNHGTIIVDPQMSTATNSGTIVNHGTIILKAIPTVEPVQDEKRNSEWYLHVGTLTLWDSSGTTKTKEEVKRFKNFFNTGTIINYGLIVVEGGAVSSGEIINKANGKIELKNFFYNEGKITNEYSTVVSEVSGYPMHGGFPGLIENTGTFTSMVPVGNSGNIKNSGTFNGEVINICEGTSSGVTQTSSGICPPSIWWPMGDTVNSPTTFRWNAATGYLEDITKYKFLIVSNPTHDLVKSVETSNLYYTVSLPDGSYDISVFPTSSEGSIFFTDSKRTITVEYVNLLCLRDEFGNCIEITTTTAYSVVLTVATDGPLDLTDIVVFSDNGVKLEDRTWLTQLPENTMVSGGWEEGPYWILINPNGENGITWNKTEDTLTSEGISYSVIFSGDCDGTNFIPFESPNLSCTITFNETVEPVEIPPPTAMEGFVESDLDYDGIGDNSDNCLTIFNPYQEDSDGDGIGDACELLSEPLPTPPDPTTADSDGDDIFDDADNCPTIFNPDQADSDGNGIGDACEPVDTTDDTVPDTTDDTAPDTTDDTAPDTTDDTTIPAPTSPVPTPTTSELSKTIIEQFSIPKYKLVKQIPISGEIQNYIRGNPVEIKIVKPDGTTESIGTMAKSSGEYFTQFEIDHTAQPGIYDIEVKYGGKILDSFSIKMVSERVPEWIKNNAGWWAEGAIGEKDFVGGIQFLIKENIIDIADLPEQASDVAKEKVPDWIKNNAGWWAKGLISEDDFVNGIKFLVEKGIIVV